MRQVPPTPPENRGFGAQAAVSQPTSVIDSNKVIRNTYMLLSLTIIFSAITASVAVAMNMPPMNFIITIVGFYGLMFLTHKLQNSVWGLVSVFAFTGFMGLSLGPIVNFYLQMSGPNVVSLALASTGAIFLALSGYALTSKKDFSFLGGFIMAGFVVLLIAVVANLFFQIPAMSLAISSAFVLFSSAVILWQTSELVHGRETNYISATVMLYVQLYNLFLSLLQLLGAFSGDD